MHSLKIIGTAKDVRTNTHVLYAQIHIDDYLQLVGDDFDRFDIQRPRQAYKAYSRMKSDVKSGALLPPITLAINPKSVSQYLDLLNEHRMNELVEKLKISENIYILDGLQRTYILKEISQDENFKFSPEQYLLLEFWLEKEIKHLIYRLIVLNAGQKPMSMRHQVELLFMTMQDKIQTEIKDLELFNERDETRRTRPRKFPFDRIVTAYYCFITKSSEIKRENIVVQELNESDVINSEEDDLNNSFLNFIEYLKYYVDIDTETFRVYHTDESYEGLKSPKNWLAEENTISSFFAAVSSFGIDERRKKRTMISLDKLKNLLLKSEPGHDPLALKELSKVRGGISPKKFNVGVETRKVILNGFKEYFREEGELSFVDCWRQGSN